MGVNAKGTQYDDEVLDEGFADPLIHGYHEGKFDPQWVDPPLALVGAQGPFGLCGFLGDAPLDCLDAADFDDGGALDITDAVSNLNYQFLGGPEPAPPGPANCGPDAVAETPDLGCARGCVAR